MAPVAADAEDLESIMVDFDFFGFFAFFAFGSLVEISVGSFGDLDGDACSSSRDGSIAVGSSPEAQALKYC